MVIFSVSPQDVLTYSSGGYCGTTTHAQTQLGGYLPASGTIPQRFSLSKNESVKKGKKINMTNIKL